MKRLENIVDQISEQYTPAGLYLIPTPIGNIGDITLRALIMLEIVDEIWAEDTRNAKKLLSIYDIDLNARPLRAVHDHNESQVIDFLIELIKSGKKIGYISDAGMPMISDPGFKLARAIQENGLHLRALPGASSVLSALVSSSFSSDQFQFVGFLPAKEKARNKFIETFSDASQTVIFFESTKRILETLRALRRIIGGKRKVAILRELSKKFEEHLIDTVDALIDDERLPNLKGELVVVVEAKVFETPSLEELENEIRQRLGEARLNDVAKELSIKTGLKKSDIYNFGLSLIKEGD